jgi:S1-C subfamily serine protease
MKNVIKIAFLTSVITAALVYVVLEWRPLRPASSEPPEVSLASSPVSAPELVAPAPADLSADEQNNIAVYQRYGSGVVNITTTTLEYDFFLRPVPTESGTGSGAAIDDQGHIVTNFHVIRNAQRIEVTFPDKSKHTAEVVGVDANNDLAVIKTDAPRGVLTPIPLGTSGDLQVGQKVLAIGNPYGLERTLTSGIISSLGRSIQADNGRIIENIIQTDAAINPGNSGGPLLNSKGQIIGINTAIFSPSNTGNIGIGFAIPVDTVRRITKDLITLGYVPRAYLGVAQSVPLPDVPWLARALELDAAGLLVVDVQPNTAAAAAGIRGANRQVRVGNYVIPAGGDVIVAFDGKDVGSAQEMAAEIDRHKPGDRVTITILRGDRRIDLPIVLQEAPKQ